MSTTRYDLHYLPFIEQLLAHLAGLPLVVSIDGSEVGRGCMTLMVRLIYQKRAIPLVWTVVDRPEGHLAAQEHIALLEQLQPLLPENAEVILLGDGEFDSIALQRYLTEQGCLRGVAGEVAHEESAHAQAGQEDLAFFQQRRRGGASGPRR